MPSVAQVVERLGATLVVGSGGQLAAAVDQFVVTDPIHPVDLPAHALVLAPGYQLDGPAAAELIQAASAARAAGILVKGKGLANWPDRELAVVVVEPSADWAHVITLLRGAVTATGTGEHPEDSLFGLADALAGICGGSVVLHDPGWQLIAYSGGQLMDEVRQATILGRRAPSEVLDQMRAAGLLTRLWRGEVIEVPHGQIAGMSRRVAIAARAGEEVLATIWVQPETSTAFEVLAERLRRGADVAALTLLHHQAAGAGGASTGDAAFHALLGGARTERLVAEQLDVRMDTGFVLAGLRPTAGDATERAATARRLRSLTRSYCDAYRVRAQVAASADTTYLLFACTDAKQRQRALQVISDMHNRLQREAPHRAMLSPSYHTLNETFAQRDTVDELLGLAERRGWSGLTDSDHVQASWRLEQFREVALAHPGLLAGPITALVEHDREHGTELVATLRAFFDAVGDIRVASEQLGVHVNTVRHRIRRAQQLAGLDLDDADERLLAELQVRLLT